MAQKIDKQIKRVKTKFSKLLNSSGIYTITVGYFIFLPNGGWEYCAAIAFVAAGIAATGSGSASLDNALEFDFKGGGLAIALGLGLVGAVLQLALFYRPQSVQTKTSA